MPFIATCVDAIGTVFWDRPVLLLPGESFDTCSKAVAFYFSGYTSFFNWLTCFTFSGEAWVHWEWWGNLNVYVLGCDEVILLDGFNFLCNAISMRSTISIMYCGELVCLLSSLVGKYFSLFLHCLYHLQLCHSLFFGRISSWKYTRRMWVNFVPSEIRVVKCR